MTEQEMKDRAQALINNGKLQVTEAKDLAKRSLPDTTAEIRVVSLSSLPDWKDHVENPTVLNLMWVWFIGYAEQQVVNSTTGKTVTSPFAMFDFVPSLMANFWKWATVIVVVVTLYFILK